MTRAKQYLTNKPTFNTVHFYINPLTCLMQKRETFIMILNLALLSVVFRVTVRQAWLKPSANALSLTVLQSSGTDFPSFRRPSHAILSCPQNCIKDSSLQTIPQQFILNSVSVFLLAPLSSQSATFILCVLVCVVQCVSVCVCAHVCACDMHVHVRACERLPVCVCVSV